jgi:hypothetical protein
MNVFFLINNKIEGKDRLIKLIEYFFLFVASNVESSSEYKKKFYDTYSK